MSHPITEAEAARNRLVEANMGLAMGLAREVRWWSLDLAERRSSASYALICAAANYDPTKGAFSTYATRAIRRQMQSDAKRNRTIPLPHRFSHRDDPEARLARDSTQTTSLGDLEAGGVPFDLRSREPDPTDVAESLDAAGDFMEKVGQLPPRERQFVTAIHGLDGKEPVSMTQLARRLGTTRQFVSLLYHQGIEMLRASDAR